MELNSMLRSVVRYFDKGQLRRRVRTASPSIEGLEAREVMTASVMIESPLDKSVLGTNAPTLVVQYSEDVNDADVASNYLLLDSAGNRVALANPDYGPGTVAGTFTATFDPADINGGVPLPLDTYTLFVRGDQITDASDGKALALPNTLIATSGPRHTVSSVQTTDGGTFGALGNYPVASVGSTAPSPVAVAAGDVDGDSLADLVLVNAGTGTVNVYLGRSAGNGGGFATIPDQTLLLPTGPASLIKDVSVSDFDNDGRLDIAVMNFDTNSVSFFRNTAAAPGSLAFAAPISLGGLNGPREMAAGDIDGDGFTDLVVANGTPTGANHFVTVFRNNQSGGFFAGQNFNAGDLAGGVTNLRTLAVADFDGDGDADIAVGGGNGLILIDNDSVSGTLSLTRATAAVSTTNFRRIAAVQVDGGLTAGPAGTPGTMDNTSIDIVGISAAGDVITLFNLDNATATTTTTFLEETYAAGVPTGGRISIADLDNDGRDEILVTSGAAGNQITVFKSSSKFGVVNSASAGPILITSPGHGLSNGNSVAIKGVVGNPNANGPSFLVSAVTTDTFRINAIGVTPSTGPGFWAKTGTVSGASNDPSGGPIVITAVNHGLSTGTRVTIANVGGNTTANGTFLIRVLSPNTFELVGSTPTADYTSGGTWTVAGSLAAESTIVVENGPEGITTADTNGDGRLDIVTANQTGNSFTLLPGAGDRQVITPTPYLLPKNNTGAVAYGDLNADGIKDIVAISNNPATASSRVSVLLGKDDGTFEDPFDFSPVSGGEFFSLSSVALVNVTGDSRPDIVVTGTIQVDGNGVSALGGVAILKNTSATATGMADLFAASTAITTDEGGTTQAVGGDFDGDGVTDLAVAHNSPGGSLNSPRRGVTFLKGNGGGTFDAGVEVEAALGFAASGLVAFDRDNDGRLDLAVSSADTPSDVLILKNRGAAGLGAGGTFETGLSNAVGIVAGDFNGDGFQDLALASGSTGVSTGGVSVLINRAGTGFVPGVRSDVVPGTPLSGLVASDVNLDGKTDLVVSATSGASNNVYLLAGKNDASFQAATPYHTGDVTGTALAPSRIAIGDTPLLRLVTFTTGGNSAQTNLVANGGFEAKDLNAQQGNLTGWTTVNFDPGSGAGSAGQWGAQSGSYSPISGVPVVRPEGTFQAMLDEADTKPVLPGQANTNTAASYAGTHTIYQDIFIPVNATSLSLSLRLYIQSFANFSNTAANPSLDYRIAGNQQVRVDILKSNGTPDSIATLPSVSSADVLVNVFKTTTGQPRTQIQNLTNINLASLLALYRGKTVRLRIASANNLGKLVVGVDNVKAVATYSDGIAPTVSSLRLRTPATNAGVPQTTDPTLRGKVSDNGGINNVAYIEFDPTNTGFLKGNTFRTSTFDASGNFSFTFPSLSYGTHTVAVRVVDRAGNASTSTITFEYLGLFTNEFQAAGPTGIRLSDATLGYGAVTGRITSIENDSSDPTGNSYYVGTAGGGVWKTTDGGATWAPLMNNVISGNRRIVGDIGAMAASKSLPGWLYAGLGVADLQLDSRPGSGILKSVNGGATWVVAGNSATVFANARISKIVVDPQSANIVYVAVASGGQSGPGVYKTANGGLTWTNILSPAVMNLAGGGTVAAGTALASVTDLVIDPFNRNRLLVGLGNVGLTTAPSTTAGLWLTTNALAAAPTWNQILGGSGVTPPPNSTIPSGVGVGTVKVAIAGGKSGDESTVYVLIGSPPGSNVPPAVNLGGLDTTGTTGLYKTSNNLLTFTHVSLRQDTDPTVTRNFQDINLGDESTYAASLAVDPTDKNVVYLGGSRKLDLANTLTHALIRVDTGNMVDTSGANTGNDITKAAAGSNEGVYWYDVEQQAANSSGVARLLPPTITGLRFDRQGRLLIGTDGGLWRGTSLGFGYDFSSGGTGVIRSSAGPVAGMTLTAVNGNLQIASATSAATDPTNSDRTYMTNLGNGQAAASGPLGFVSQDLSRSPTGTFNAGIIRAASPVPGGGDTPTTLYRIWKNDASGNLLPEVSTDNGQTWVQVPDFLQGGDTASYFPALVVSPTKVDAGVQFFDELLFGTDRVYQSRTSGNAWDIKSPVLDTATGGRITALGVAPVSQTGYYYAGLDNGQVYVNSTGGSAQSDWPLRTAGLPTGLPVTSISVAKNPAVAAITFGGTNTTTPRVYYTVNGGLSWSNVSFNLPREAAYSVVLDNRAGLGTTQGKLYVATASGVFARSLASTTYYRVGTLPSGAVVDLSLDPTKNVLAASVQGRGVFKLSVAPISPLANLVLGEDESSGPIKFTLNNLAVPGVVLRVTATSSDQTVVRNAGIVLGGVGNTRTITILPVLNQSGTTVITLRATDGLRVFTTSFTVTVNAVNDVPTISAVAPLSLPVNSGEQTVSFTIGDVESDVSTLTVSATSDNQGLIDDSTFVYSGAGANQTLKFTPSLNTSGTARITISVTDPDGGVGTRTFDVRVVNPNALLPFDDNFDGNDNTFLGDVWSDMVGGTALKSNAAETTAPFTISTLNGVAETNVDLSADINLPARSNKFASLVARYQGLGDRNYYMAGVKAVTDGTFVAYIFRNLNGVYKQLAAVRVASGTGKIEFEAVDNSLKLFLDGSMVAHVYDSAIAGTGSVGLRGAGGAGIRFDNFHAEVAEPLNPGASFTDTFDTATNKQLDRHWVERSGSVRVEGGFASNVPGTTSLALLNPTFITFPDMTVESNLAAFAPNSIAGVVARSNAAGTSYYQASLVRTTAGPRAVVSVFVNGVGRVLGSAAVASSAGLVSFNVTATTLTLSVDGVVVVTAFDATLTDGTAGIIGNKGATWQDFTFTAV